MLGDYLRANGYEVDTAGSMATRRGSCAARPLRRHRARPDAAGHATASTSAAACAPSATADPDADRARRRRWTASSASRWAPTTTCPSPSSRASCWRGCARCCDAPAGRRASEPTCCASAGWRSTRGAREVRLDGEQPHAHRPPVRPAAGAGASTPAACCRATRSWTRSRASRWRPSTARIDVHISRIRAASRTTRRSRGASSPCAARAMCSRGSRTPD